MIRRLVPAAVVAIALLSACSSGTPLSMQRYYDPNGFFSARIPAADQLVVVPPQTLSSNLDLLGGVVALPQAPSPSPSNGLGGGIPTVGQQQDTALYTISTVSAKGLTSVDALAQELLGQTINAKRVGQQRVIVGGIPGLLVVADHKDPTGAYSDASAFFLFQRRGYWVREIFTLGDWQARRDGFRDIMESFVPGVPAGLIAVPLVPPGMSIESKLVWPLG